MKSGRIAMAIALIAIVLAGVATGPASAQAYTQPEVQLGEGERALAFTTAGDGSLWFAGSRGSGLTPRDASELGGIVGRISGGKATVFATRMHGGLTAIALGGDGALWATDPVDDAIVRASTEGAITSFPLPSPDSRPTSIVAGPEGALWFTETGRDAVGRISTAGSVEEFPLPTGSEPTRIVTGRSGDLWVAAKGTGSIDRITTAGLVTAFPIGGGPQNKLHDLAIGPDGAVWFTQSTFAIGRLGPDGRITEFPLPRPARSADLIVAGPGGRLWFNTGVPDKEGPSDFAQGYLYSGNGLASITTTGHPTYPSCISLCNYPFAALYFDPGGALRYGLGDFVVLGGGGSALAAGFARGLVGTYHPQPGAVRVMVRHAIAGRAAVVLPVECRLGVAGERCRGRLALTAAGPGRARRFAVGTGRYDLLAGGSANVSVRLGTPARRLLADGGRLSTKVGASGPIVSKGRRELVLLGEPG